jgi:SAM-dependent methyltransferase
VQLLDVIDPEVLFRNYLYVTGTSATMAAHNRRYARTVVDLLGASGTDLIVEVASNDGSLLRCFQALEVRTLGVEPATNIAEQARANGVDTVNRFFHFDAALDLRATHGAAKAVIANNVLAHVDDTQNFLKGCRHLLTDDGLVIVEVPYLRDFLDRLEYDTVYHEHLCYFSVGSLMRLFEEVGLSIVRIDRLPVHGGSLRIYGGRAERYGRHAAEVDALWEEERRAGLEEERLYQSVAEDVAKNRRDLRQTLDSLRRQGKTIAGYGAPAKGNTLLNYCQIGTDLLQYTVDKNPLKVGLYTPGMHIPVLPVSALLERQPDYVMILAWNFAEEIMEQQQEYRDQGGRFLIPIPEPRII